MTIVSLPQCCRLRNRCESAQCYGGTILIPETCQALGEAHVANKIHTSRTRRECYLLAHAQITRTLGDRGLDHRLEIGPSASPQTIGNWSRVRTPCTMRKGWLGSRLFVCVGLTPHRRRLARCGRQCDVRVPTFAKACPLATSRHRYIDTEPKHFVTTQSRMEVKESPSAAMSSNVSGISDRRHEALTSTHCLTHRLNSKPCGFPSVGLRSFRGLQV